jgi:hypothetical protein
LITGGWHGATVIVTVRVSAPPQEFCRCAQNIDVDESGPVDMLDPVPIEPPDVSDAVPRYHVTVTGLLPAKETLRNALLPDVTLWSIGGPVMTGG